MAILANLRALEQEIAKDLDAIEELLRQ